MADKFNTKTPKEKWADQVRVIGYDPITAAQIATQPLTKIDDHLDITDEELILTPTEKGLIAETTVALNLLRKKLGLDPIFLNLSRFHVLTQQDWGQLVAPYIDDRDAVSLFGHCYFVCCEEKRRFAFDLSHEIVHAAAFLSVKVVPNKKLGHRLILHRSGLSRFHPVSNHMDYLGLTEGVTELIGVNLRGVMSKISKVLNKQERQWLENRVTYEPTVRLVCNLAKRLAQAEGKAMSYVTMALMRDYFTGSTEFLRLLHRHEKETIGILRDMDDTDEAALAAATRLNFVTPPSE